MDLNNDPFDAEIQRLGLFQKPDDRRPPAGREQSRRRLGKMTAAELLAKDLPEVRYIIPGYIAEGLTLLGGKPKLGKSWLIWAALTMKPVPDDSLSDLNPGN